MTQLVWNDSGERFFEAGVDRGVLYQTDGFGVVWNGLTAVTEAPSGAEAIPYYLDGVKYLNIAGLEEFSGTIEAFTFPDEFSEYDGTVVIGGLNAHQQLRKSFGLSYRTKLGNDISGTDHAYKIHIVYNALATPSEKQYITLGQDLEPLNFSWSFTTTPEIPNSLTKVLPLAHISIDSTQTTPLQMRLIEDILYGVKGFSKIYGEYFYDFQDQIARLPSLDEVFDIFERPWRALEIISNTVTGLSPIHDTKTAQGDLIGVASEGLYKIPIDSRLVPVKPGVYSLEP